MDAIAIVLVLSVIAGIGLLVYVRATGAASVGPVIGGGDATSDEPPLELDDPA
jgi:hypothetical protein